MLYVQATLLALHVNEQPDSGVTNWVRINTPVEVLAEQGDMLQVRLMDRPDEHPVTGWVVGEYLDTETVTIRMTHDGHRQALAAGDEELAATWNDRMLAIDPTRAPSRVAYGTELPTQADIAVCEEDRVQLLGALDADGFHPGVQYTGRRQLRELSAQHWLRVDETSLTPIEGSPFVAPFATGTWNEEGRSAYVSGTCEGICDEEGDYKVVLGPCEDPGALYVSAPIAKPLKPKNDRVEVDGYRGRWIVETGGMEVRADVTFGDHYDPDDIADLPSRTWLQVGDRRFVFLPTDGKSWGGMRVYEVTDAGVLFQHEVGLFGSGC